MAAHFVFHTVSLYHENFRRMSQPKIGSSSPAISTDAVRRLCDLIRSYPHHSLDVGRGLVAYQVVRFRPPTLRFIGFASVVCELRPCLGRKRFTYGS